MKTQLTPEQIARFETELIEFVKLNVPEKYGVRILSISVNPAGRVQFSANFRNPTASLAEALNE